MSNFVKVAIDAMGGDHAPKQMVMGAVHTLERTKEVEIYLVGKKEILEKELEGKVYDDTRLHIQDAREVIETSESPVTAIKKKKDSSLVVGMRMVKKGEADGFISAGNSGAMLAGGQLLVGRSKGVERAPFAPVIPTLKGPALLLDSGANVDARASHLVQFAKMGNIYMRDVLGIKNPRIALLNIGSEEEKGNALTKETYPLLKECEELNFIGNIEAREIPEGVADVIVCEAFAGNIALKTYEGTAKAIMKLIKSSMMSSIKGKIGGLLVKSGLKKSLKQFDTKEHGGAPMLGLRGLVVKTHGNATYKEISNAVMQCLAFQREHITEKIIEILNEKEESKDGI